MDTGNEATAGDDDEAGRRAAQFDAWLALTGRTLPAPGPVRLPMLSGSMSPALPCGCLLAITPRAAGALAFRAGDVVVLAGDDRLVAHRLLLRARWRGRTWWLEMGDANRRGAWRPEGDIVGRVDGATTPDGRALPPPHARRFALRGLLRHLRGLLLAAPAGEGPPANDRKPGHAT